MRNLGKVIEMAYYHQTLQRDTSITHAAHGNFTDQVGLCEIAISTGRWVKLLIYHRRTNHIQIRSCFDAFSRICSMKKFWCEIQRRVNPSHVNPYSNEMVGKLAIDGCNLPTPASYTLSFLELYSWKEIPKFGGMYSTSHLSLLIKHFPWPARSPNPSPIEHVWDMMGRRLHLPGNVDDLGPTIGANLLRNASGDHQGALSLYVTSCGSLQPG
ncbi:hypothetical protein TNCV_4060081 [Trichonephila clavipes]|nr:hypothetical protein TNCV_4060081 [Trichonephila clavipes]